MKKPHEKLGGEAAQAQDTSPEMGGVKEYLRCLLERCGDTVILACKGFSERIGREYEELIRKPEGLAK